jgi:hypothetical protein
MPSDYFRYHQVKYYKIRHGAHIAFMCFVRISQQTAISVLHTLSRVVLFNRGQECLLRGTH